MCNSDGKMFRVFTFTLTHFLAKTFSRGYGGPQNSRGNSRGVARGYFCGQKMEIPGRRGAYVEFPQWWGYRYFVRLYTMCQSHLTRALKTANMAS